MECKVKNLYHNIIMFFQQVGVILTGKFARNLVVRFCGATCFYGVVMKKLELLSHKGIADKADWIKCITTSRLYAGIPSGTADFDSNRLFPWARDLSTP